LNGNLFAALDYLDGAQIPEMLLSIENHLRIRIVRIVDIDGIRVCLIIA